MFRLLMASSLPKRMELTLIDSTSPSVPAPSFANRLGRAATRLVIVCARYLFHRPDIVLLFSSPGASFIEKSVMGALARMFGIKVLMFPRGAQLIADYKSSPAMHWYWGRYLAFQTNYYVKAKSIVIFLLANLVMMKQDVQ